MTGRMPIAERVLRMRARGVTLTVRGQDGDLWGGPILEAIDEATFFDVQVGCDIMLEQWKTNRVETNHVFRLPYDYVWLEWHDPVMDRWVAALLTSKPDGYTTNDDSDDSIFGLFWTWCEGWEHPRLHPITTQIVLDSEGGITQQYTDIIRAYGVEDDDGELQKVTVWYTYVLGTALSLINCRNVQTRQTGSVHIARTGRQKRQGIKPIEIRYHTIILPGGGSEQHGSGSNAHHRATAMHRVRGHFKTFTKEKPLLGKHVGRFWWGWQVRGNPEKGIIVSDYKLDA